jgi:hypothetical protein
MNIEDVAGDSLSAVDCEEGASGRRIWSRVSGESAVDAVRMHLLFIFSGGVESGAVLPFLSGLPRRLWWRKGQVVYVDSCPLHGFLCETYGMDGLGRKGDANGPILWKL